MGLIIWKYAEYPYLCTVFFIVLDLRLTKVGVQRYSFFFPIPLYFADKSLIFKIPSHYL